MSLLKKLLGYIETLKSRGEGKAPAQTHRDYGREALDDSRISDLVKGVEFFCALDEHTCLTCLELDGRQDPPTLPIHEGCRCVTVPILKTWGELGLNLPDVPDGTRSSAIGPVAKHGGLYKQHLIQRARGIAGGLQGAGLGNHLKAWLKNASGDGSDLDVVASIQSAILAICSSETIEEVLSVLARVRWNAPDHRHLFAACAEAGAYSALTESLQRMAQDVPDGPYAGRHQGMLYRAAVEAVQPYSLERAVDYMFQATEHDPSNVAVLMQLAGLLRRIGKKDEARQVIEGALRLSPTHKGALRELERLNKGNVHAQVPRPVR